MILKTCVNDRQKKCEKDDFFLDFFDMPIAPSYVLFVTYQKRYLSVLMNQVKAKQNLFTVEFASNVVFINLFYLIISRLGRLHCARFVFV